MDFLAVGVFQAVGMGKAALSFAILRKIVLELKHHFRMIRTTARFLIKLLETLKIEIVNNSIHDAAKEINRQNRTETVTAERIPARILSFFPAP